MSTKIKKKSRTVRFLEEIGQQSLSFGGFIESIRLGDEITQVDFAKKLGISRSHLCDIEKGRKSVSVAKAAKYAKILKYSKEQFVRLALQDEVHRAGLKMNISVEKAS